ncbi:MAG: AsmA-like C-terminal region-containing protein [Bacteroidota bacterium]
MKGLRRLGIVLGIFLLVLLIGMFCVSFIFEKQIANAVLKGLNANLKEELYVEQFDLSLFSGFPNAAVNLTGVQLPGSIDNSGLLIEAEKLSLKFGLASLFSKRIRVRSIIIDDGAMLVYINRKGEASYNVFQTSDQEKDSEAPFALSLKECILKDIELIYIDEPSKIEASWNIDNLDLAGQFSNDQFSMKSTADFSSGFIETEDGRYLAGKKVGYIADIDIDLKKGEYIFREAELLVDKNSYTLKGEVLDQETYKDVDLEFEGDDESLASVVSLLPAQVQKRFGDFDSDGQFFFKGNILGKYSPTENPAVNFEFGLNNGKISSKLLDYDLKNVSFTAKFDNGEDRTNAKSAFEIPNFVGYLKRELIEFDLRVSDLDDPKVVLNFDGTLPMAGIHGLIGIEGINGGSGEIEITELNINGRYADMIDTRNVYRVSSSGNIEFDDASLKINGEKMSVDRGTVLIDDNDLTVEDLKIEGAGSEIILAGSIQNALPVLLADSLNTKSAELKFNGSLNARNMDFDRLAALGALQVDESDVGEKVLDSLKSEKIIKRERLTKLLDGAFDMEIEEFNYNKIEGENFKGRLAFDNNKLQLLNLGLDGMNGKIQINGDVNFKEESMLEATIDCIDLDIKELFRQCEDFGQEVLMAKHVKGRLNSKVFVDAFWDEEGNFLTDKLYVLSDLTLNDGELKDFKMLESFSTFVKAKDLGKVQFTETKNQFGIINQTLYIPTMFIQTTAMNLIISGKQEFDYDMEYLLKVNAGQVLWNKIKPFSKRLKPKKAKKKGFINVYVTVDGDIDEYDFKTGKKLYNERLAPYNSTFNRIRTDLQRKLNVNSIVEDSDWDDDSNAPDIEFDPGDQEELDMGN